MKRILYIVLGMMLIAGLSTAFAQDKDLKTHPGYIDLSVIDIPVEATEVTDITLDPNILRLVAKYGDDEDDDVMDTVSKLLSIRVISFNLDVKGIDEIFPKIEAIEKKLNAENWNNLIQVRKGKERTRVAMKIQDDKIVGFLLMSVDPEGEVSFINIVGGSIDFETIQKIGMDVDGSALDSLKHLY
jgi:hypothetical protein